MIWSPARTASLIGGAVLGVVGLLPGLLPMGSAMGDSAAVEHLLPHVLAMGVVPLLLVHGAPPQLLANRWVRLVACRWHPAVHALEYYGGMAAFVLTPWSAAAMRYPALHVATHAWMLACGLCFYSAVLEPQAGGRGSLSARARRWLVAAGAPLGVVLALAVLASGTWGTTGTVSAAGAQGWVLAVGGAVTAVAGLALVGRRGVLRTV